MPVQNLVEAESRPLNSYGFLEIRFILAVAVAVLSSPFVNYHSCNIIEMKHLLIFYHAVE